jgi:hypothetical protein
MATEQSYAVSAKKTGKTMYALSAALVAFAILAGIGAYLLNENAGNTPPPAASSDSDAVSSREIPTDLIGLMAEDCYNFPECCARATCPQWQNRNPSQDCATEEEDWRMFKPFVYDGNTMVQGNTVNLEENDEYIAFDIKDSPVFETGGLRRVYERLTRVIIAPYAIAFTFETLEGDFETFGAEAISINGSDFSIIADGEKFSANPTHSGWFYNNYMVEDVYDGRQYFYAEWYKDPDSLFVSMLSDEAIEEIDLSAITAVVIGDLVFELA